jgi:hypothetical protein
VGIKPINQITNSEYFNDIIIKSVTDLEFKQFIYPPDFLKDKYTSVGRNISEWPHYELIKYLDNNLPLDDCDYVKRTRSGTLDFRNKGKILPENLKMVYRKRLNAIKKGEKISIKVCLVYDKFYTVADGKHSLAMAYYFNYHNLRFDVIPNLYFDTYFRWIFEKRIKNDKNFGKHNDFFRKAHEHRKKETDRIIESGFNK